MLSLSQPIVMYIECGHAFTYNNLVIRRIDNFKGRAYNDQYLN